MQIKLTRAELKKSWRILKSEFPNISRQSEKEISMLQALYTQHISKVLICVTALKQPPAINSPKVWANV